ncbi:DNA-binding IclR family transcriptional regulator [Paraburkholderia sp. GAS448]|uniref:MarR family transcriptional regulator n=1 Tax=Paraburkholderia sp. GAS448 TaxID=3035136 RepID=UPI003D1E8FA8
MTKAVQNPALTPAKVLAYLTPGTSYTGQQIARLAGYSTPEVQKVLAGCVARGMVRQTRDGGHSVYCVPTEEDIRLERERADRYALPTAILLGYDAANRRSRETSHGSTRGFQAVFVSGVIWKPSADARRLSAAMLRWRCCSS